MRSKWIKKRVRADFRESFAFYGSRLGGFSLSILKYRRLRRQTYPVWGRNIADDALGCIKFDANVLKIIPSFRYIRHFSSKLRLKFIKPTNGRLNGCLAKPILLGNILKQIVSVINHNRWSHVLVN